MTATLPPPHAGSTLATVEIKRIEIDEHFNPRTTMDDAQLAEITDSVRRVGIIQPLVVTGSGDGPFRLVAGHRRLAAAHAAELATVPALVYDTLDERTRLQLALIENLQREDINAIDEATGYERAMRDFNLNQKQLAQMLGKSPSHVSERLKLRKLPERCQQFVAAGRLPLTTVKTLTHIAKTSPAIADGCARLVADGDAEPDDLANEPHYVVSQLLDVEWDDAPFLHPCRSYHPGPIRFRGAIDEPEIAALSARANALAVTRLALTSEDIDAARAYGCLLEFEGPYAKQQYVTDARFTFDRLSQALDATEAAQAAEIAAQTPPDEDPTGPGDDQAEDAGGDALERAKRLEERRLRAEQQQRAKERQTKERRRTQAIAANRQLGIALAKKLGARDVDRDVALLLARMVLRASSGLAARGVRLTHAEYHTLEHVRQKNGNTRTRFTVIELHAAEEQVEAWVTRPKQPSEIVGRLLQALVAGTFADQEAIATSNRAYWSARSDEQPILAKLAAKLLPEPFRPQLETLLPKKPTPTGTRKQAKDAS
jgi:ParB/RepB/Spo0J family partition protein